MDTGLFICYVNHITSNYIPIIDFKALKTCAKSSKVACMHWSYQQVDPVFLMQIHSDRRFSTRKQLLVFCLVCSNGICKRFIQRPLCGACAICYSLQRCSMGVESLGQVFQTGYTLYSNIYQYRGCAKNLGHRTIEITLTPVNPFKTNFQN